MWTNWCKPEEGIIPCSSDPILFIVKEDDRKRMYNGNIQDGEWRVAYIDKCFDTEDVLEWAYIPEEVVEKCVIQGIDYA